MSEPLTPEALVEMKERCARALTIDPERFGAQAIEDIKAMGDLIVNLLDVIEVSVALLRANNLAPIGAQFDTPAWRSVATVLKREGT